MTKVFTQQLTESLNVMPRAVIGKKKKKKSCKLVGEGTGQIYLVKEGMGEEDRQPPAGALVSRTRSSIKCWKNKF